MKQFIIGLVIGMIVAGGVLVSYAWHPGEDGISIEELYNKVFDSTTNTIRVKGV